MQGEFSAKPYRARVDRDCRNYSTGIPRNWCCVDDVMGRVRPREVPLRE